MKLKLHLKHAFFLVIIVSIMIIPVHAQEEPVEESVSEESAPPAEEPVSIWEELFSSAIDDSVVYEGSSSDALSISMGELLDAIIEKNMAENPAEITIYFYNSTLDGGLFCQAGQNYQTCQSIEPYSVDPTLYPNFRVYPIEAYSEDLFNLDPQGATQIIPEGDPPVACSGETCFSETEEEDVFIQSTQGKYRQIGLGDLSRVLDSVKKLKDIVNKKLDRKMKNAKCDEHGLPSSECKKTNKGRTYTITIATNLEDPNNPVATPDPDCKNYDKCKEFNIDFSDTIELDDLSPEAKAEALADGACDQARKQCAVSIGERLHGVGADFCNLGSPNYDCGIDVEFDDGNFINTCQKNKDSIDIKCSLKGEVCCNGIPVSGGIFGLNISITVKGTQCYDCEKIWDDPGN